MIKYSYCKFSILMDDGWSDPAICHVTSHPME